MNTYKKEITVPSSSTEKMYLTKVNVYGTAIFTGKIFVMPYQTKVMFDFTDIFSNYIFNGAGILKPTYSAGTVQQYIQPTTTTLNLNSTFNTNHELIKLPYNLIVSNPTTGATVVSASDTVYLRSYAGNNRLNQNTWRAFDGTKPISHYPVVLYSSNPFRWGNTLSMSAAGTMSLYRKNGNNYTAITNWSVTSGDNTVNTKVYTFRNYGGQYIYCRDNGQYKEIAFIDVCNAPYYLVWIDNDGAMACHRFTPTSEYSEAITVNTRVSTDDTTFTANQFVEGKWKLKSYNLTDQEYEYYMSIINSPYIMLYNSEKQKCTYVRITDKSLARKEFTNNKNKPVFMEINLQEITPKNYLL